MQLREKIGGLFMVGFDGTNPPESLAELIQNYFVGGVILFRRNIRSKAQLSELISQIKKLAEGRPFLIAVDHEGGRVFRMPPPFTQWQPMATVKTEEEAYETGKIMAEELKEVGFNVNFAPVLDVNTDIKNPCIGDRAFSNDPFKVASLGISLIKGLQDNGIIACGKHFPGHGDATLDSHTDFPVLPHTLGRLEALELVPFRAAVESGVKSIMTAHVVYEGIDPNFPATLSPIIVNDLLRKQIGYKGVVFTDDLQMTAVGKKWPLGDACVRSVRAGCDVCLICRDNSAQKNAIEEMIRALTSGELSETVIDAAYRRVSTLT